MNNLHRAAMFSLMVWTECLLANPAAAIDVCGNGICATQAVPPENATNCPDDCGAGPIDSCPENRCIDGSCTRPGSNTDADEDGVLDRLEYDLAHKFFPSVLLQSHGEDRNESYLYHDYATPYTIRRYTNSASALCNDSFECLEIRWAIAFFYDHGDTFLDLREHEGDSEMYAALLRRTRAWSEAQTDAADWQMIRDFTSAHSGGRVGAYGCESCSDHRLDPMTCNELLGCVAIGYCTGHSACSSSGTQPECLSRGCTWTPDCSQRSNWRCYSSAPLDAHTTIYCAESKHALYHTDGECDGGAPLNADECPSNRFDLRDYKAGLLQNVGNANAHQTFDTTIEDPSHCGSYDVWNDAWFGEVTPYRTKFTSRLDWVLE